MSKIKTYRKAPVFPYAPGVIDGQRRPRRWLWSDLTGALALVALAYFVAGYLS